MQTGSYLELALTIYAWQVSNRLAEMIVASGLIYLPLLFIVWQNWSADRPQPGSEIRRAGVASAHGAGRDRALFHNHIRISASGISDSR